MTVAICFRGAKVHIKIHTLTFFCKNFQIFFDFYACFDKNILC